MANNKNTVTYAVTSKVTVPASVTKQGTINSLGTNIQGSDTLTYNTLVGAFTIGAKVIGTTSKAYGTIYADSGTVLKLTDINGVFVNTEVLTDNATAVTAAVNGVPTYTLFTKQCKVGDFLYNAAQTEIHKIVYISNDLSMQIQEAFGSVLANQAVIVVPFIPHPKEISVIIPTGSAAGLIDGVTWPVNTQYKASKLNQSMTSSGIGQFVDPIIIDGTGTTMIVNINY